MNQEDSHLYVCACFYKEQGRAGDNESYSKLQFASDGPVYAFTPSDPRKARRRSAPKHAASQRLVVPVHVLSSAWRRTGGTACQSTSRSRLHRSRLSWAHNHTSLRVHRTSPSVENEAGFSYPRRARVLHRIADEKWKRGQRHGRNTMQLGWKGYSGELEKMNTSCWNRRTKWKLATDREWWVRPRRPIDRALDGSLSSQ